MKLHSCQLAREETACIWMCVHTQAQSSHSHSISTIQIHTGFLALFRSIKDALQCMHGSWSNHDKYANLHLITFILVLCRWGEFYFSISCCQQAALLWILLWKMLILLLHFLQRMTIWQPIYSWMCVWCSRSQFKVSQTVLSVAFTILPPCGGSWRAACSLWPSSCTFFMPWCCHRKKKLKASGLATRDLQMLSEGRTTLTYNSA